MSNVYSGSPLCRYILQDKILKLLDHFQDRGMRHENQELKRKQADSVANMENLKHMHQKLQTKLMGSIAEIGDSQDQIITENKNLKAALRKCVSLIGILKQGDQKLLAKLVESLAKLRISQNKNEKVMAKLVETFAKLGDPQNENQEVLAKHGESLAELKDSQRESQKLREQLMESLAEQGHSQNEQKKLRAELMESLDKLRISQHENQELQAKHSESAANPENSQHLNQELQAKHSESAANPDDSQLVGSNGELEAKYLECLAEKDRLQQEYEKLQVKFDECSGHGERLNHQVEQLRESESRLQRKHETLIKTNEEHLNQKSHLEKMVETLEQKAQTVSSLDEKITCQERRLLEKTQRILSLEASLKCVLEITKKADMNCSRLDSLQAIPEIISSHCEALSLHITDTAGKLHDSVTDSKTQLLDKMDSLLKAWDRFRSQDMTEEEDTSSCGGENIPMHFRSDVQLLCNTLGPNWLDAGRALGLDGDKLERIWVDWGQYLMRELAVRVIECWCANSPETSISLNVLKTAMAELEINPLVVEPMGEDDRRRLRENYQLLLRDMMDVTHIEGYLRQAGILSAAAVDYIIYPSTSRKRIQRLLKILPFSGSRALSEFKGALMQSGQTHLALAIAGEQCSASKTGKDILGESPSESKDSNISKCTSVDILQNKRSDDRKMLENILDNCLNDKMRDVREMFESVLDERLEVKNSNDREMFERISEKIDEIQARSVRASAEKK